MSLINSKEPEPLFFSGRQNYKSTGASSGSAKPDPDPQHCPCYFCGSFLPSWIRIWIPNPDPDPLTRLNLDPDMDTDPDPQPCLKVNMKQNLSTYMLTLLP
jgi:hypothetical protein